MKRPGSFAAKGTARCDLARRKERDRLSSRASLASALVGAGTLAVLVPSFLIGHGFLVDTGSWPWMGHSLLGLATTDVRWAAAVGALVLAPIAFVWWRRSAPAFGRALGIASSLGGGFGFGACVLLAPQRPWRDVHGLFGMPALAATMFVVAFMIAPAPTDPDAQNALSVRRLLRRHRESG